MSLVDRADFPAAARSTYLNAASVALMPRPADAATASWQQDIAENGTLNFDEVAEERVFDDLRSGYAAILGARSADIAVGSSVLGVAADSRYRNLTRDVPTVYLPLERPDSLMGPLPGSSPSAPTSSPARCCPWFGRSPSKSIRPQRHSGRPRSRTRWPRRSPSHVSALGS